LGDATNFGFRQKLSFVNFLGDFELFLKSDPLVIFGDPVVIF